MFLCKECGLKCSYDSADELCSRHTKDEKRIEQNRRRPTPRRDDLNEKKPTEN